MDFANWMARTRSGATKPRSPKLKSVDDALRGYLASPSPSTIKRLSGALESWKHAKRDWQQSMRNRDHAVEELDALVKLQSAKLSRGEVFAKAAARAREIEAKRLSDAHRATVAWSQTITYKKGSFYHRWDKSKRMWVKEHVLEDGKHRQDFPETSHFEMVKRGTVIEVKVYCKAAPGTVFAREVASHWRTEIISHWSQKAYILDQGRKYDLRFDLVWDPHHPGAYVLRHGNPPPTVHKWGMGILQKDVSSDTLRFSEVLELLLNAPDDKLTELVTRLSGNIQIKKDPTSNRWKKAVGLRTAPLSTVLKSLASDRTFWVKNPRTGKAEGPFMVRDSRFRSLISGGYIREFTPVRKAEESEWQQAADVSALSRLFTPQFERNEKQRLQDTTVNRQNFGEYDRKTINHEFGHMIGNPDEYMVTSISNTGQEWDAKIHDLPPFSSDSIMNNPLKGKIEARHFACVLREYNRWQNAEATLVMKKPKLLATAST